MTKTIVAFKGKTQYDVLNDSMDCLVESFRDLGKEVCVIDVLQEGALEQMSKIDTKQVDFLIGFNGVGLPQKVGEKSPYDEQGLYYVCYMVDTPLGHLLLDNAPKSMCITCVDRTHVEYMRQAYPHYTTEFLPHGGCLSFGEIPAIQDRPIDILFSGSFIDDLEIEKQWKKMSKDIYQVLKALSDRILEDEYYPFHRAKDDFLRLYNLTDSQGICSLLQKLMPTVIKHVRAVRRKQCLALLSQSGIPVHIYGKNWEKAKGFERHVLHDAVSFSEILKKMKQAKIVLNITSCFPEGSHERVFSSMRQGAVCLTDDNSYYQKERLIGTCLQAYSWKALHELPVKVSRLLNSPSQMQEMAERGKVYADREHSWKSRAKTLLEIVERAQRRSL